MVMAIFFFLKDLRIWVEFWVDPVPFFFSRLVDLQEKWTRPSKNLPDPDPTLKEPPRSGPDPQRTSQVRIRPYKILSIPNIEVNTIIITVVNNYCKKSSIYKNFFSWFLFLSYI